MWWLVKKRTPEISGVFLCVLLGMVSGWISNSSPSLWYQSLLKPSFNPPSWVFGPVWTLLYITIGIVFGLLWKQNKKYFYAFGVHFIFNLLWSPLFFGLHRIDLALYDLIILWITLIAFMIIARSYLKIITLLIPYGLWITFALVLNFEIVRLNIGL